MTIEAAKAEVETLKRELSDATTAFELWGRTKYDSGLKRTAIDVDTGNPRTALFVNHQFINATEDQKRNHIASLKVRLGLAEKNLRKELLADAVGRRVRLLTMFGFDSDGKAIHSERCPLIVGTVSARCGPVVSVKPDTPVMLNDGKTVSELFTKPERLEFFDP